MSYNSSSHASLVTEQELIDNPHVPRPKEDVAGPTLTGPGSTGSGAVGADGTYVSSAMALDGPPQPVRDEELLGEDDSDDEAPPATTNGIGANGVTIPVTNGASSGSQAPSPPAVAAVSPTIVMGMDDATPFAVVGKPTAPVASAAHPSPPSSAADVEASAREILRKRLGADIPGINHGHSLPLSGLFDDASASANRASPETSPEAPAMGGRSITPHAAGTSLTKLEGAQ